MEASSTTLGISDTLLTVFFPVGKIVALTLFGFVIFRMKKLPEKYHSFMSKSVMYVTLPCLFFYKLVGKGSVGRFEGWYWLPVSAVTIIATGGLVGFIASRFIEDRGRSRVLLAHMTAFMNAGYLPLVIVRGCFPEFKDIDTLVMIFILGVTPLLWSVSPAILAGGGDNKLPWKKIFNPPLITIFVSFIASFAGVGPFLKSIQFSDANGWNMADVIFTPLQVLGEATVPLILFVLGGTLAKMKLTKPEHPGFLFGVILTKLVFMPLLGLMVVPLLGLNLPFTIVLLVEFMSPTALNTVVQAKEFADEETSEKLGEAQLFMYLSAVVTLTVFLVITRLILL